MALANGVSVLGLRGFTAVPWSAGEAIELLADIDIGLDAPIAGQHQNPSAEHIAPNGIAFSAPDIIADALALGNVPNGDSYGVWRREWIVNEHQARPDVIADTLYSWS